MIITYFDECFTLLWQFDKELSYKAITFTKRKKGREGERETTIKTTVATTNSTKLADLLKQRKKTSFAD